LRQLAVRTLSGVMQLAGDRERESAAASLREHFVGGRLTLEELSERTEAVLRARSRGELRRSLDGLPQFNVGSLVQGATRVAALVLFTGAWLMFSFVLLVVLGLTALVHGVSGTALLAFLLVWLVPTYLLTRVWRSRPARR
jgi:hypothetical protein